MLSLEQFTAVEGTLATQIEDRILVLFLVST